MFWNLFKNRKLLEAKQISLTRETWRKWAKQKAKAYFYEAMTLASEGLEDGAEVLKIRDMFLSKETEHWNEETSRWEWAPEGGLLCGKKDH